MKNTTKKERALILFTQGKTSSEVATALNVAYQTAWQWKKDLQESGVTFTTHPVEKTKPRKKTVTPKGMKAWVAARSKEVDDSETHIDLLNNITDHTDRIAYEALVTENTRLKNTLVNIITRNPDVLA